MKSTAEIKVPEKIIDQVIGQDEAVDIIKKAALQRRHVLLIGDPGTGKSMLGFALAELLPKSELKDILSYFNPNDENTPLIKELPAGQGRDEAKKYQLSGSQGMKNNNFLLFIVAIITLIAPWWIRYRYQSDIMFAAFFIGGMMFLAAVSLIMGMGQRMFRFSQEIAPKLIVDNFGKKQAPFYDVTGSHAGALLGDVLHDPFQSLGGDNQISVIDDKNNVVNVHLGALVDKKLEKNRGNISQQDENNYEATFLHKNELIVLGETNGSVSPVGVLSCNRYDYVGEMIKLTTSENEELIITPEHKVAIWRGGKIKYVGAQKLKDGDEIVAKAGDIIIDEQDIIDTYDKKQQEQCKLYYDYQKLKIQNPTWGYKRISKALRQPEAKTRWWHAGKHIPTPIQTAQWLKRRKLLPLKINNSKLPLIAKVLGTTFGDGGIFTNLNAIFLSSSELEATEEFGIDLMKIFGYSIDNNTRTIQGGRNGTSFCYQNTNRNIIRFFAALNAPIGNKTKLDLIVPGWIKMSEEAEQEFYGSLFGNEIGIPKIHVSGKHLNTFDFAVTGKPGLEENRTCFLNTIKDYLANSGIKTGKILKRSINSQDTKTTLYRFLFSTEFENLINFSKSCKLNYCRHKKEKLTNTINEFKKKKSKKYLELLSRGYGAESAMNLLNLTPSALYEILNDTHFIIKERSATYS